MNTDNPYEPFNWQSVEAALVQSPILRQVLDMWKRETGGAAAPTWNGSVLEKLPTEIIRFANVIDVGDGTPPFAYRFFGSGLARMHTFELTNKTTDEIEPEGFRNLCGDQHLLVIEQRRPLAFINDIPTKTENLFHKHVILRLPYIGDGNEVSNILTVEDTDTPSDETWEHLRQA